MSIHISFANRRRMFVLFGCDILCCGNTLYTQHHGKHNDTIRGCDVHVDDDDDDDYEDGGVKNRVLKEKKKKSNDE